MRGDPGEELRLDKHEFLEGLDGAELELLAKELERRELDTRTLVVRKGESADELFALVRGELSVLNDTPTGRLRRLSTLSAGMGFGEPSSSRAPRAVPSSAPTGPPPAGCSHGGGFQGLAASHPDLTTKLLRNLLVSTSRIVERLSHEALADQA